nr:MAG TPA: hypothetical protein [Inoviridae sp.]
MHRFRVLKVKFQNFIAESTACEIYAVFSVSWGGKGAPIARSHFSQAPPPQHRIALLARKPHLISDDASRADCVRAFLFSGLRRMKFHIDKFLKFHYH